MIENTTMQRATCDGCGKLKVGEEYAVLPGFHVNATEVREDGSWRQVDIYGCSYRCAGKTVASALRGQYWRDPLERDAPTVNHSQPGDATVDNPGFREFAASIDGEPAQAG